MKGLPLRGIEANIWKLYLFRFLGSFTLFTPVIVLFLQNNGLSMTEVMLLQSAYSAAVIGLEVPSGYLSDTFGRRKTLMAASSFLALGIGFYSTGQGFWLFLAAEMTFAVGGSLQSGADSALMYDTLKDLGRESEYKEIWGKTGFYALMSMAAASIIGGVVGEFSLRYTLLGMIPVFAVMVPLSYSMKEPEREKKIAEEGHLKDIIQTGKSTFLHNSKLRWIIVYSAVLTLLIKGGYFLYQPYFKEISIPVSAFGAIFAALNVVSAIASRYASQIEEFFGLRNSLISLVILTGAGFLFMGYVGAFYGFLAAFAHNFVRGFSRPVISDYINRAIESRDRSTVLSFESLSGRIVYASAIPFIGMISDTYTIQTALTSLGITSFLLGGLALLAMKKGNVI